MKLVMNHVCLMSAVAIWLLWLVDVSCGDEIQEESEGETTLS